MVNELKIGEVYNFTVSGLSPVFCPYHFTNAHASIQAVCHQGTSRKSIPRTRRPTDPDTTGLWTKGVNDGIDTDFDVVKITPIPKDVYDLKKAVIAAFPDALGGFGSTQLLQETIGLSAVH
jgi:hypothetical protein